MFSIPSAWMNSRRLPQPTRPQLYTLTETKTAARTSQSSTRIVCKSASLQTVLHSLHRRVFALHSAGFSQHKVEDAKRHRFVRYNPETKTNSYVDLLIELG